MKYYFAIVCFIGWLSVLPVLWETWTHSWPIPILCCAAALMTSAWLALLGCAIAIWRAEQ